MENSVGKKSYPGLLQSLGITALLLAGEIAFFPVMMVLDKWVGQEVAMLLYYLLAMGVPLFVILLIRKSITGTRTIPFRSDHLKATPYVVVATIALLAGIVSPLADLIPMPESIQKAFAEIVGQTGVSAFLMMVVAAPLVEETIFRGIMLDGLLKRYSPKVAILISSVLFGLVHLNPWQFITGLIIGAFSGWIYYRSGRLFYSVIAHAAANLSGFVLRFFVDTEKMMSQSTADMYGGPIMLFLVVTGSVVLFGIATMMLHRMFPPIPEAPSAQTVRNP
ncbi:MAG: lysostaphin resistance A-like protein [Bacteroidales bacterium]